MPRLHKELNVLAKLFSPSVRTKPVLGFATVSHSWSCLRVRLVSVVQTFREGTLVLTLRVNYKNDLQ